MFLYLSVDVSLFEKVSEFFSLNLSLLLKESECIRDAITFSQSGLKYNRLRHDELCNRDAITV